ncbi:MAG TPA: undecaprenyl-diphosphatase UppP [Bryobacteraceae bacterium]|nr:undecaprenyl-diphosphatase UppP [Bryobacteraceae bacterium]
MPLYQVILLAFVQGVTEFLPISSSAHLALAPWLLGWKDPGLTFDIALHLGTLIAVIVYFYKDWMQLIAQGFGFRYGQDPDLKQNPHLLWLLAAGTIPVGIAGVAFSKQAETTWRSPFVIATMLILVGVLMWIAEKRGTGTRSVGDISPFDAVFIGLAQALAVIPGTSRSGITMTAGMYRNLDRPSAARFSFLLATPATGAAGLKALYDLYKLGGVSPEQQTQFIIGIVVSGLTGAFAISVLLRFLRRHSTLVFIVYRILLGIIVVALAFSLRAVAE